ncbi:MAG: hypothetical protein KC547_14970, partial [Anaerolineae bacterium]|nr:hypothetical protein [Anaerolineae bacterium]
GGQSLQSDPGAAFAHNLAASAALTPLAPWLLLLAALLLPFDVAVRRLLITRSDLQRLRQALTRSRNAGESSERISSLMGAKARAQQQLDQQHPSPSSTISALRERQSSRHAQHTDPQPHRPAASPPARGLGGRAEASASRQEEGSTASRLLDRQRERRQDRE